MNETESKLTTPYVVEQSDIQLFKDILLELSEKFNHLDILEWGSGGSTIYYPTFLRSKGVHYSWLAMEYDPVWAIEIMKGIDVDTSVRLVNVAKSLLHKCEPVIKSKQDEAIIQVKWLYVNYPATLNKKFHLIYVDGRFRTKCLNAAAKLLKPGGVIVLDNAERIYYHDALQQFDGEFVKKHWWKGELA